MSYLWDKGTLLCAVSFYLSPCKDVILVWMLIVDRDDVVLVLHTYTPGFCWGNVVSTEKGWAIEVHILAKSLLKFTVICEAVQQLTPIRPRWLKTMKYSSSCGKTDTFSAAHNLWTALMSHSEGLEQMLIPLSSLEQQNYSEILKLSCRSSRCLCSYVNTPTLVLYFSTSYCEQTGHAPSTLSHTRTDTHTERWGGGEERESGGIEWSATSGRFKNNKALHVSHV